MTSDTTVKKDIQKLQRAIIDGLEDVKGQDIVVFNTEELSPLFERVIIASGTSNRHTKALAASVRDAVKDAGFDKPRIEGEENGEWIIVDCGQAVAHVMQPVIRQYYRLEEIWGAKPVRLKLGAEKAAAAKKAAAKKTAKKDEGAAEAPAVPAKSVIRKTAKAAAAKTAPAKKAPAAKTGSAKAPAKSGTAAKKAPAKKTTTSKPKADLPKLVVNKPAAKKPVAKKTATKSAAKPAAKKPAAKASKAKA